MVFSRIRNRARNVVSDVKQGVRTVATTVKSAVTKKPTTTPTPTPPTPLRTSTPSSSIFQSAVKRVPNASAGPAPQTSVNVRSSSGSSSRNSSKKPTIASQVGLTNTSSQRLFDEAVERKQEYNKKNPTINRLELLKNTSSQRLFDEAVERKQEYNKNNPTIASQLGLTNTSSQRLFDDLVKRKQDSLLMSPDTGYIAQEPKIEPWTPPMIYDGIESKKEPIYREDKIIQQLAEPSQEERKQRETTLSQLGYGAQPIGRVTMGFGYGPMPGYQAVRTGQRDNAFKDYAADFFNRKQALPTLDPGYRQAQKSVDRMFGENIASGRNFRAEFGDPIERTKKKMRKFL